MTTPKRILPSSTPPPQRPAPLPTTRKHVLRVSQACTSCRRQKMRCEGADNPPCVRCHLSSTNCIFEKTPKPQLMDSSVRERLAELEQEIEMVKATQRQMQTMLSEILNELRRRPGRPPQSASTESPATSSWHTGVALPAAQIPSAGSMSEAPVTRATTAQPYMPPSNSDSGRQLSADIAESPANSSPTPRDPNQLSRKRKGIASSGPGSVDHHHNYSKRSRGESSSPVVRLSQPHHQVSLHGMQPLRPESKEQNFIDKQTLSSHDTEQLFALYAYMPPVWS